MSTRKRPIALIGAMDEEIEELLKHSIVKKEAAWNIAAFTLAELEGRNVVIIKSGVGKVFAAMMCERMIDELHGYATEMERGAVAQVCTLNKLPFLVVRTVSDKADGTAAEDFNKFLPVVAKNSYSVVRTVLKNL